FLSVVFGMSPRGAPFLHVDGHKFLKHEVYRKKVRWTCIRKGRDRCRANCTTEDGRIIRACLQHNHDLITTTSIVVMAVSQFDYHVTVSDGDGPALIEGSATAPPRPALLADVMLHEAIAADEERPPSRYFREHRSLMRIIQRHLRI
ncbi:hypothetical protein ACJJTC_009957, partial [Scirpophaga incertulas]